MVEKISPQAGIELCPLSNIKRKSPELIPNTLFSAVIGLFSGTQERVQNSHGKRTISLRASEVLLYISVSIPYLKISKRIISRVCYCPCLSG